MISDAADGTTSILATRFCKDEISFTFDSEEVEKTNLDGELACDLETFPVGGLRRSVGDIVTDLLGGETERSHLWRQRRCGSNFATDGTKVDNLQIDIVIYR